MLEISKRLGGKEENEVQSSRIRFDSLEGSPEKMGYSKYL